MELKVKPSELRGFVNIPSSKSISHRMIIAASLADGESRIANITMSEDIEATIGCMKALGADISKDGNGYVVKGIQNAPGNGGKTVLDCRESGSTLRFLIPVVSALGMNAEFRGAGRLPERPITPYKREMSQKGVIFEHTEGRMPFYVNGQLKGGDYEIEGNISSQFITGLLTALPLIHEDSTVKVTSELESKPYADMTKKVLKMFGINIPEVVDNGLTVYNIPGKQRYKSCSCAAEGDYSQAAFFLVANALGANIEIGGLNKNSVQGDRKIVEIINNIIMHDSGELKPFDIDISDIPDLAPVLTVLGCFTSGVSRIYNAGRLRLKESDRIADVAEAVNAIGGKIKTGADYILINPVDYFTGGKVDGKNDHRIVMSLAIASLRSKGDMVISGGEAVNKSYPLFWDDFKQLGGKVTDF